MVMKYPFDGNVSVLIVCFGNGTEKVPVFRFEVGSGSRAGGALTGGKRPKDFQMKEQSN